MELFDLAKLEGMTATDIYFTQGVDPILAAIKQEIVDFEPDTTTDKGRKAIASLSGKVSSCKARMEKAADSLTEEARKQTKKVNLVKKQVSEECATLRDLARKPLTDYEAAQQLIKDDERKQAEIVLAEAEAYHLYGLYLQQQEQERIAEMQRQQQEEIDRQMAELEAAQQKIIDDEAERVRLESKAKVDALLAEEAEVARVTKIEIDRIAEEDRKKQEEERIEAARLQYIADEKKRQTDADALALAKKLKREENQRIVNRTHSGVVKALMAHDVQEGTANIVLALIADGKLPKVSITY